MDSFSSQFSTTLPVPPGTDWKAEPLPNIAEIQALQQMPEYAQEYHFTKKKWDEIASTPAFIYASDEEQQAEKDNFIATYGLGQAVLNQEYGSERGSLSNLAHITRDSFKDALTASKLADDVLKGTIDNETPQLLDEYHINTLSRYTPYALRETQEKIQSIQQDWKSAKGFLEASGAFASGAWRTLAEVFENPEGVLQLFAQSSGNMAPIMGGTLAGSAVAGPVGAAIGGFSGSYMVEAGHRLIEEADKELARQNLEPSEDNYRQIFQNQEFTATAMKKANLKAAGTALTDMALSELAGKIATAPYAKARAIAGRLSPLAQGEKAYLETVAKQVGKIRFRDRITAHLKGYATELISEPVSEAAGQKAAGDKLNLGELAGEFLGGVGGSVVTTFVDKTAFGSKKIADVINKTRKDVKYKQKIADIATTEYEKYGDMNSEDYDPIAYTDTLLHINRKKETTPEDKLTNFHKVANLAKNILEKATEQKVEIDALTAKDKAGTITSEEEAYGNQLVDEYDKSMAEYIAIANTLPHLNPTAPTETTEKTNLKEAVETGDSDSAGDTVLNIFGSNGGKDITTVLQDLKQTEIENTKQPLLAKVKDFGKAVTTFETFVDTLRGTKQKTAKAVHQDILNGTQEFTGIYVHQQTVAQAIKQKDTKRVHGQLQQLSKFVQDHRVKTEAFTNLVEGKPLSAIQQKALDDLSNKANKPYDFSKPQNFTKFSELLRAETALLHSSVRLIDGMVQHAKMDNTITQDVLNNFKKSSVNPNVEQEVSESTIPTTEQEVSQYEQEGYKKEESVESGEISYTKQDGTKTYQVVTNSDGQVISDTKTEKIKGVALKRNNAPVTLQIEHNQLDTGKPNITLVTEDGASYDINYLVPDKATTTEDVLTSLTDKFIPKGISTSPSNSSKQIVEKDITDLESSKLEEGSPQALEELDFPVIEGLSSAEIKINLNSQLVSSSSTKRPVAAQVDRNLKTISLNPIEILKTFKNRTWTKPKIEGVHAYTADAFKTIQEWELFLVMYEQAHLLPEIEQIENLGDRENAANQKAFEYVLASRKKETIAQPINSTVTENTQQDNQQEESTISVKTTPIDQSTIKNLAPPVQELFTAHGIFDRQKAKLTLELLSKEQQILENIIKCIS